MQPPSHITKAFMWIVTGGGFGLGWLRDLFRMSAMVEECNNAPEFVAAQRARAWQKKRRSFLHLGVLGGQAILAPYGTSPLPPPPFF